MTRPRATHGVAIATHNRLALVTAAIESVLGQTLPVDDVVVVDDGGTDGSADALSALFPEIRVIRQRNLGQSVALNVAIAALNTDFVSFLDDDDLWHPEKMRVVDELIHLQPDTVQAVNHALWTFADHAAGRSPSDVDVVGDTVGELVAASEASPARSDMSYLPIHGESLSLLLERNRGTLSGSTIERQTLLAAGLFRPELQCGTDWSLFVSVARLVEWHHIERRLAFTRHHDEQHSATGGLVNGISILAAMLPMWFGDKSGLRRSPAVGLGEGDLIGNVEEYTTLVRSMLWSATSQHRWRDRVAIKRLARPLFPRRTDWLKLAVPPPALAVKSRILRASHRGRARG